MGLAALFDVFFTNTASARTVKQPQSVCIPVSLPATYLRKKKKKKEIKAKEGKEEGGCKACLP